MAKIMFEINSNTLILNYKKSMDFPENLTDTNIISHDKLVFSTKYIDVNQKLVKLFIKDLIIEKNINSVIIENLAILKIFASILDKTLIIERLTILDDVNFSYEACEILIKSGNIKLVNCYAIPTFMIELLDKNNIKVEARSEILFASNFMLENNLSKFTNIYYKTSIRVTPKLNEADIDDFKSFCYINKYLKNIHFNKYDKDTIQLIADILKKYKIKRIKIYIHENINNAKDALELKQLKKKLLKEYKLYIKVVYSNEYIKDNYAKQIILTTLKYCSLLGIIIIFVSISYIFLDNKISESNTNKFMEEIHTIIENNITDANTGVYVSPLNSLLEINDETVGWIKVNNTNIDYPVVQHSDKDYYLNHNFKNEKDSNGWVFMDPRNNKNSLDQNTIIYGHNRFYSGVMFGTLGNVLKEEWYSNPENLIITFNTLYGEYSWKIFSIYSNPSNGDYLITKFDSDIEYSNFINMIKDRSIFNNDVEVNVDDKILTLSTCLENDKRLVVHAVLI